MKTYPDASRARLRDRFRRWCCARGCHRMVESALEWRDLRRVRRGHLGEPISVVTGCELVSTATCAACGRVREDIIVSNDFERRISNFPGARLFEIPFPQ